MKQIGSVADGCGQTCLGLSHIDFATTLLQSETQTLAATKLVRSCLISALQQSYCSLRLRLTDNPCLLVDHRALCAAYSNAFMPQQRQLCFKQHLQTFSSIQLHTKASAYKCICVQQRLRTSASAFSSICLQQHLCSTASAFNSTCVQHPTASVFNIQQHCAGWQGAGPSCVFWGCRQCSSAAQHWCSQGLLRCGHAGLARSQLPNCVGAAQVLP